MMSQNGHGLQTKVELPELSTISKCCKQSALGKLLPSAFYIHRSALECLDPLLQAYEALARQQFQSEPNFTLIKFHLEQFKLSYLSYPNFDTDPHPALHSSLQVNLDNGEITLRNYSQTSNPPILHRKETFVAPSYPRYTEFAHLTQQQEKLGLLDDSRQIGTQQGWNQRLAQQGVRLYDHAIACPLHYSPQTDAPSQPPLSIEPPTIARHKAAMVRKELSKPVRLALEAELFEPQTSFFDYGCGHGSDLHYLRQKGYQSNGWDPHYQPNALCCTADIVNLGYIINVIEDPAERRQVLLNAWDLAQKVLIVAAQVLIEDSSRGIVAYSDGIITRRNTFQKYYEQQELKAYIDGVLEVDAIPVALGIYFVFRDETQAQNFRASRFRSRAVPPRVRLNVQRFETHRLLLQPLMDFYTQRGRLPNPYEAQSLNLTALQTEFGSLRRAFQIVLKATSVGEWDAIADKRRQDILVYLALSQFDRRPRFRDLSEMFQNDIKGLFGSYQQACAAADLMLIGLGKPGFIATCCQRSAVGRLTASSLWVHISALEELDPMLRLYEGCANRTIGRMSEATLIKFHLQQPKITYLFYPDFDSDPHPQLHTSMQIDLRDLQVSYRDYNSDMDCPILHYKESYVTANYPHQEKFAKLTRQEKAWGLLDNPQAISTRNKWQRCLIEKGADLKGHRLVWRKDVDPYRIKILRSSQRTRSALLT
jgi:DNA phosphorothioation-associated putative methyltransferase